MDKPQPPPWGALIERHREQLRPKLSVRKAAIRAGVSEGWWRQITSGYASAGRGQRSEVYGAADTLARMARVVGVTAEQLEAAGRPDAADEMRRLPDGPTEIAAARIARGLSLPDVARAVEVSEEVLTRWEAGEMVAPAKVARLRAVLGLDARESADAVAGVPDTVLLAELLRRAGEREDAQRRNGSVG